jgi:hypothetical protein
MKFEHAILRKFFHLRYVRVVKTDYQAADNRVTFRYRNPIGQLSGLGQIFGENYSISHCGLVS